ncbi:DNA-binding protein [Bacteroidia bacterium]|nr:DNA-binding protein [Bacteroidia bacterium]
MTTEDKYSEWFFQSDYDLETAEYMLNSGRTVYCLFMCHLSLEKALKGLYLKRLNEIPPKLHDLRYLINKISLEVSDEHFEFLATINSLSIATRYPSDLRGLIAVYSTEQTASILQQTKIVQQWIKQQ